MWGAGEASSSLDLFLGPGKKFELSIHALEERFARPEGRVRPERLAEDRNRSRCVVLLEPKRSTAVGIVMNKIKVALGGKELREAIMDVDENTLRQDVLKMVLGILPTAEEAALLRNYEGEISALDRPEQLLRSICDIPRLEGRLRAMTFKALLEGDMHALLFKEVDTLKEACAVTRSSTELQALMQIVLHVGNALNAGTSRGNASGFRASALEKLFELKATDKKSTLLHFTAEVVRQNAPGVSKVSDLITQLGSAARISLDELRAKRVEVERGIEHVDSELTYFAEQLEREAERRAREREQWDRRRQSALQRRREERDRARATAGVTEEEEGSTTDEKEDDDGFDEYYDAQEEAGKEEDLFAEIMTDFYNWAVEQKDIFERELSDAERAFASLCSFLGESNIKEPQNLFQPLQKFLMRFDAINKEMDEAAKFATEAGKRRFFGLGGSKSKTAAGRPLPSEGSKLKIRGAFTSKKSGNGVPSQVSLVDDAFQGIGRGRPGGSETACRSRQGSEGGMVVGGVPQRRISGAAGGANGASRRNTAGQSDFLNMQSILEQYNREQRKR